MKRDQLITQVKAEYARLVRQTEHMTESTMSSGQAYYERTLQEVLDGIQEGRFDTFDNGRDIMEAVANQHDRWVNV